MFKSIMKLLSTVLALPLVSLSLGQPQGTIDTNGVTTRLGLVAQQLGVAPVPGAIQHTGVFVPGAVHPDAFSRDDSCWCQPINQVCTSLRPENLDLVTRIINRPGSSGAASGISGCNAEQRTCCTGELGPSQGLNQGFPSQGFPGQCGSRSIFNGIPRAVSPTADFGEYPWMAVVLGPGQAYLAGGVLVGRSWVLTAPHKLTSLQGLSVRLGDYDVSSANDVPQFPSFEVPVARVIAHPQYNSRTLANDVALLQLAGTVDQQRYPHVTPACLPAQGQRFDGQRCFVSGWGQDAFGPGAYQRVLQEVDLPVVGPQLCQSLLRNTRLGPRFTLNQQAFICAGGERDKDSCQGDGGSPLVCPGFGGGWTVAGLVAWGIGCAQENVPAAYVNVASYVDFLRQHVN